MFKVIFIAGVIFGGCLFSVLAKTDSLTLYTEHFPPYNFKQNNDIVGINTELVQAMCLQAAIQCQFKLYPWLRAYENALRNRHSALFSTSRIPQREADFQWVGPLMYSTAYLYRLRSRQDIDPKTIEEAKQFVIGVAHGDVYEIYLKSIGFNYGANLVGFVAKADSIGPFLQNKIDLIVGSPDVIPVWLQRYGMDSSDVEPILPFDMFGFNYLALNQAVDPELVSQLQQALDQLKASGEAAKIQQYYLENFSSH